MEKYSLKTGLREQTILKDVYFTPPFNLVEVRENKKKSVVGGDGDVIVAGSVKR